jgi:cytochrome c oxidase subunit 1
MNRGAVEITALLALLVGVILFVRRARRAGAEPRADGGYGQERSIFDVGFLREQLVRWTTTVDHKEIGILYIVFGTIAALWGGVDAMMLRTELLTPAADIWTERTYNALFTEHGITMLIFFVLPVFFGIGNYFIPLLIGADDMAFPRLNAIGFWLLPPALLLARFGLFAQIFAQALGAVTSGPLVAFFQALEEPGIGWTMYTPLSTGTSNPQIDFLLLGLHLSGIATTVGAINFIVTIFFERDDSITWADLDILSWNLLTTSAIALFAFPLLGSAIVMLLMDRNLATTFYAVEGGSPILWQHLFWFWGHPEVYILFLPATGLLSTILPKFVGRKLFGFKYIVYSTLGIAVMSFGVWAHHMFTTALDPRLRASFMAVSVAIAVPSAIKTFNWITTIWDGNIRLSAPAILCIGSLGTFVVGGVTGVFLAAIPVNIVYHGTYYVVGHFHMIVVGIIPMMMIAASYYWYPILTGRMYDRRLAKFQSALLIVGSVAAFGTLIVLGFLELPRRYANYPAEFAGLQQFASVGAFLVGVSALLWLYNMLWSYWNGEPVEDADVWDLKESNQFTLEWQWFERKLEREYAIEPTEPDTVRASKTTDPAEGSPQFLQDPRGLVRSIVSDTLYGALGGFVGTAMMSAVLLSGVAIGVIDLAAFGELSELVGLGTDPLVGFVVFFGGGMTTWAILFRALAEYLPGRLLIVTGLSYAAIISLGFFVAFYTGQSGLELLGYVVFVFVGHMLYGLGLAGVLRYAAYRRTTTHETEGES